jgi:hypothetical protein
MPLTRRMYGRLRGWALSINGGDSHAVRLSLAVTDTLKYHRQGLSAYLFLLLLMYISIPRSTSFERSQECVLLLLGLVSTMLFEKKSVNRPRTYEDGTYAKLG